MVHSGTSWEDAGRGGRSMVGDGLHLSAYRTSRTKGVITLDRTSPFDVASDPAGVHTPSSSRR